jgi:SpoIID/LytB domain protein
VLVGVLVFLPATGPAAAQSSGFSSPNLAPGDDLTFRGAGWGHGVGISHQSLPARTAAGQSAADILNAYYPGTILTGGWQMDDLRIFLSTARNSRFRPRGAFEIVVDGSTVYSSSTNQLFSVAREGNGWTVTASGGAALCPAQVCSGNVLQIRTADGVAVESSATGHSYSHGQITLTKLSGDSWYRIVLTNLEMEDYLRGVAEVPPDWASEALRAQAIASRTYALHIARENRASDTWTAPFDLYSSTMSQVYKGNTRELSPRNGPWLQAVADTAGQVLTYNGTPALTLFTTSGGGYTENSGYAYKEQHPYLVATEDPFTAGDPYTPWTRTYSVSALSRWLARVPDTNVGTLQRIDVSGNISVSGRIDRATVRLTGTSATKSVSGQRLVFVINKGAESEGWGPLPNTSGRGGHLLSTKFVFAEAGALPEDLSTAINVPTIPSGSPPAAPRSVSATPRPNEILVTWQPPADDGGSPITGYTITWRSSTGASGTIPTTETSRTLRNLANGATYTISIAAISAGGTSPQTTVRATPLDTPTAPESISVSTGPGEITVSWLPPTDGGGSPITGYTITWRSSTGASGSISTTALTHTLRGLANGVAYTINVAADNSAGSSPTIAATATPLGTSSAPRDVRLQRGDGRLGVSWSPPADDGGLALDSYTVYWTAPDGAVNSAVVGATEYVIDGLTNGATYSVTVSATNRAGASPHSEKADLRPGTAPSAPRGVTADRGDSRIDVTWQPPASDGGLGITRYEITWVSSTGATGTVETTEVGYTMRNLLNGATYTVTVAAANEAGTSPASDTASATAAATPSAPTTVTVDRGDGRINVTWQPPASDGGRPVLSYIVTWTAPDGTTGSIETVGTSHTFDALTNGTTYTITVAAANEAGTSPSSEPAGGTPAHIPGAPVAVQTTRDDSRLHVTWDPPISDGGVRITGYTVLWVSPDGTTLSAETGATDYTIDGLVNGITYGITVMATNEIGTSVTAEPVRATPARPPGPLASAEIAIEHEALLVTWQPPTDDGGLPVRSYTLTWVAPDGTVASVETTQISHLIENLIGGATYSVTILANNEVGASVTPMSAEATPQHAAPPAAGGSGDVVQTAAARPMVGEGATAISADPQPAPAAPASPPNSIPSRIRTWQDSVANDTVVIVLAAVGLILIATLLVITRRRRDLAAEAAADFADVW